ncbi:hypothetical protein GE09DRAFT_371319 [Coniochaeta sp. 2T2.1]|nr:hypothetical protein GE09DRAFT_371319 [Coniochaeta sp. 2T2.1]
MYGPVLGQRPNRWRGAMYKYLPLIGTIDQLHNMQTASFPNISAQQKRVTNGKNGPRRETTTGQIKACRAIPRLRLIREDALDTCWPSACELITLKNRAMTGRNHPQSPVESAHVSVLRFQVLTRRHIKTPRRHPHTLEFAQQTRLQQQVPPFTAGQQSHQASRPAQALCQSMQEAKNSVSSEQHLLISAPSPPKESRSLA